MKLANESIELHSQGIQTVVAFKVATNAKMMRLLSDSLYSNKVESPLRELSTNALDSHISVGKMNVPFKVHLPCANDPTFSIRDFGSGLSYEELTTMYSTYGESNRNDSNEYIGCMGLGSKSPLAYTDSFTVTSFYKGKKYLCITGRNENGPTLNVMDGQDTDEPDGLEVSFGVKREHFVDFYNAAHKVYRVFPVVPIVSGYATNLKIEEPEVLLQGSGWRLLTGRSEQSIAVMGYIQYPIAVEHFSKFKDSNGHWYGRYQSNDNTEAELLKLGLELHFPIGTIENDISRENLQYNKLTIDAIKARLVIIADEIKILVSEHFKACKTTWEARCLYQELFSYNGRLRNLSNVVSIVGTTWKGQDISKTIVVHCSERDNTDLVSVDNGRAFTRRRTSHNVTAKKDTKFYVNDLKRGAYAICERESKNSIIWLVTFKGDDTEQATAKKGFVETLGINESELVYCSTRPSALSNKSAGPRKTKQFQFKNRAEGTNRYSYTPRAQGEWWVETTVDLNSKGYYVPLHGFQILRGKDKEPMDAKEFGVLLNNANELGISVPPVIFGIRPSHVDKVVDMVNIFTYLTQELEKFVTKNKYITTLEEIKTLGQLYGERYNCFKDSELASLSPDSKFVKFIKEVRRIQVAQNSIGDKTGPLTSLANVLKYTLPQSTAFFDCGAEEDKLGNVYPMWNMIKKYQYDNTERKAVVNYVKLVDAHGKSA